MSKVAKAKTSSKDSTANLGFEDAQCLATEQCPAHLGGSHINPVVSDESSRPA